MSTDHYADTLRLHGMWLRGENGGERAELSGADMRGADLRHADLGGANLYRADLRDADLRDADLIDADLRYADLSDANLYRADLIDADLRYADLSGADMRSAALNGANLGGANLDWTGVATMTIGQYTLWCTPDTLGIEYQSHHHDDWRAFGDAEILAVDGRRALDWWRANRTIVFAIMDRCAAVGACISAGSDE